MTYIPTLADIDELEKQQSANQGSYKPTLSDIDELEAANGTKPQQGLLGSALDYAKGLASGKIDELANKSWGAQQALANMYSGGLNTEIAGINTLFGTHIKPVDWHDNFIKNATNREQAEQGGALLSAIALPELGIAKAVGSIPSIVKNGGSLAKAIGSMFKGGAGAAGEGAGYTYLNNAADPNSNLTNNMGRNVSLSAALGIVPGAIGIADAIARAPVNKFVRKIADKAAPGYIKSPEEAAAAYAKIQPVLGDTKMDLGSLIGDMPLSRKYNEKLRHTLGAGGMIADNQQQLIGNANREVNDILSSLLGNTTDRNVHDEIVNRIQSIKENNSQSSRDAFNAISQEADARGFVFPGWNKAKSYAQEILNNESKVLGSGLKGELKSLIKNVGKEVKTQKNTPNNSYNYSDAHFSHSNVGKLADELAAKQEYRATDIANTLQNKIREDIQDALNNSGNKDLYDRWVQERQNFAANVVPFRKKSLTQILAGDKDSSKISDEILASKNKDVLPHLNQDLRNLMGYAQFSDLVKGNGASLQKVVNRFQTLDRNKDLDILEPQAIERFRALTTLNNMLPEAKLATNPGGTGIRNYANLSNTIKGVLTGGAALHNPLLALGGGAATLASEKSLAKALTSDWLRNAYFNQGAKPLITINQPMATTLTNALIRAFAQQNSGDKK